MTTTTADSPASLLIERRGRVLLLTLSNPAARNALMPDMSRRARDAILAADADNAIGAVVLTGAGEHFCGGGNLNRLLHQRTLPRETQRASLDVLHGWAMAMRECAKPVIAAVEGAAAGAGCSIALGCDLIVAAEDAKFVMAYVKVALSPDGGGSYGLAHSVPPQFALEMLLDGGVTTAKRLHELGVVNRITAHGQALSQALEWAERLAKGPPAAQARIKQVFYAARGRTQRQQLDAEADALIEALYHDEAGEGIAAFLEKRQAQFLR